MTRGGNEVSIHQAVCLFPVKLGPDSNVIGHYIQFVDRRRFFSLMPRPLSSIINDQSVFALWSHSNTCANNEGLSLIYANPRCYPSFNNKRRFRVGYGHEFQPTDS
jgi:hypothetical protein